MLTPLAALLPLLFSYMFALTPILRLQQDIEKDFSRLTKDNHYFISDNSTQTPSVETVASDLQLFQPAANLDLSKAAHSSEKLGNHQVDVWRFENGEISSIYQIESSIHLDTVVTQRYLDNRTPTQQRITNDFAFRTYAVSTASNPLKLYYLTETDQGLLSYRVGQQQVEINYPAAKEGLADIIEVYKKEVEEIINKFQQR